MLRIPREIHEAVLEHAREGFPLEVCGILGGRGSEVLSHHRMTNTDQSNEHFMMDPKEQFALVKELRAAEQSMLVIYHSHPESPARPSQEDIRLALTPGVAHLIVSLMDQETPVAKAFTISEGTVAPVEIELF
ncbi:Mov34/MPN/PAD-1 family protein [Geomesophilobacter sediminis]|uniref:M67 family metallopeptidase n=1 Tax=Geomesophilobacter sediminis TaxID=2798584 RepID=A0A8J7JDH9_9BACT|nr:M67 family metallopeptidase [Geomesophilobacter sediminis]MBJ6723639.1 M67 family metallopeptidase [Geomesophilobacter sediminis]